MTNILHNKLRKRRKSQSHEFNHLGNFDKKKTFDYRKVAQAQIDYILVTFG
jgi:hypothetical protein